MDLKEPGNYLYQIGVTKEELGRFLFSALVNSLTGGCVPRLDPDGARQTFEALHRVI